MDVPALECEVESKFGIDMTGKLHALEEPIRLSKAEYDRVLVAMRKVPAYNELVEIADRRPDVHQALTTTNFPALYAQAAQAQGVLVGEIASEWVAIPWEGEHSTVLRCPVMATLVEWLRGRLEKAVDPGVKGETRAREKLKNDYAGDVSCLKDLSRLTLVCKTLHDLVSVFEAIQERFDVVIVKNKFASPTPMGAFCRSLLARCGARRLTVCPSLVFPRLLRHQPWDPPSLAQRSRAHLRGAAQPARCSGRQAPRPQALRSRAGVAPRVVQGHGR